MEEAEKKDEKGIEEGLVPEQIVGAAQTNGQLCFVIKWKDKDDAEIMPAAVANEKFPELVIRFYEERIEWVSARKPAVPPS
ncbi:unnamed protein product [Darwinula stevensoni]|uniref:Chromo domain-containing protein n=1 Tax=Darwinula stevensoni TaxID=69355 RepID=A0A7R8XB49_9CRUS|nr:unnamed protein product [Darwinula stevensoni]CAG0891261.1 unnamed protein product [Darwinula stevensoni]